MSYTEALARVAQIQSEIASLAGSKPTAPSSTAGSANFAQTLAQTQASTANTTLPPASSTAAPALQYPTAATTPTAPTGAGSYGAYPLSGASGYYPTTFLPGAYDATSTLPLSATGKLTSGQQQFASRLAADTGLDPRVVSAWLLAEESGEAAAGREREGNNDWLNIGYTDSATYGATDSVWSNPTAAAEATAGWLHGAATIPGYGTASSPIQSILATAGQTPEAQIAAIQQSGWASSGYPDLPALFQQIAG